MKEIKDMSRKRYWSRWSSFSATILSSCFAGLGYAFALYSDTIQENLGYSQESIDLVASFGELGMWSSFLVGLLLEILSPTSLFVMGSILSCVGIFYVAMAINLSIPSSLTTVSAALYLANFGIAAFLATGQSTCLRNFPAVDRGKISGILKSILGLSSAIYAVLLEGLTGSDHVVTFLYAIGIILPLVGLITAVPMNVVPETHLSYLTELSQGIIPTLSHFLIWYAGMVSIIILTIAIEAMGVDLPYPYWGIATIVYIWFAALLPKRYGRVLLKEKDDFSEPLLHENEPLLGTKYEAENQEGVVDVELDELVPKVDPTLALEGDRGFTFQEALGDLRFWCLLLAFMCGAGSGLVVINNVSSIGSALSIDASSVLVSIMGLCNAAGRFSAGWFSDKIVAAGYPRATSLCVNLVFSSLVSILLSFGVPNLLYLGAALAGVAYGSMFSVVLAVSADCFGTRHIATIFGLLDLGPASGSFLFATWLVSIFYGGSEDCTGKSCFCGTFVVCALSCLIACLCVFFVMVRPALKQKLSERRRLGAGVLL